MYQESTDNGLTVYQSSQSPTQSAGPLHGSPTLAPYTPFEALQQKRLAARRHKSTFAYDFPNVFANALQTIWLERQANGEPDGPLPGQLRQSAMPSPRLGSSC